MSTRHRPDNNDAMLSAVHSLARYGRVRIDAGGTATFEGSGFAVKAITNNFTYGADCQASNGDAPTTGDPLVQGDTDLWPCTKVVAATGSAWIYLAEPQSE